jgi:CheY-like chemotaxis protein
MGLSQKSRTIVLVDDEPFILEATARLLRSAGHTVHTCDQWTGVAAVVRTAHPDLILMDYNMPSIKGDDLCMILRRTMVDERTRIIIFSSEPESDLREIVARCGADGFVQKNVAGHVLLNSVESLLDSRGSLNIA